MIYKIIVSVGLELDTEDGKVFSPIEYYNLYEDGNIRIRKWLPIPPFNTTCALPETLMLLMVDMMR